MCWLNPRPLSPYECRICLSARTLHSSNVALLDSKLDAAYNEGYTVAVCLPEVTRHVYARLLRHESHLGPPEDIVGATADSGIASADSADPAVLISETTGRRVIYNELPRAKDQKEKQKQKQKRKQKRKRKRSAQDDVDAKDSDADTVDYESETWHGKTPTRCTASTRYGLDNDSDEEEEDWGVTDDNDDDNDNDNDAARSEMSSPSAKQRRVDELGVDPEPELELDYNQDQPRQSYRILCNTLDDDDDDADVADESDNSADVSADVDGNIDVDDDDVVAPDKKPVPLGVRRLLRFIDVLKMFTAPFAPVRFKENEEMLTEFVATHLKLITGKAEFRRHKTQLFSILGTDPDLMRKKNVIWITNRQQGKTSTLSKFLAVLSYLSPEGGALAYVYSTTRDRAQELIDASRKYLYWAMTTQDIIDKLAEYGLEPPRFKANNATSYRLYSATNSIAINTVKARPKSAEYCRGDASHTVIIDEFGFVEKKFWDEFALPLTAVKDRCFAMATTPAPIGSFADIFTKRTMERNQKGDLFMSLTNHSLVCKDCLENDRQRECSHRLYLIPPWKSVFGMDQIMEYVSLKDRATYEKEVFGIIAREGGRFFKPSLVTRAFSPKRMKVIKSLPDKVVLYVCVDPPSHDISNMGLAAHVFSTTGRIYVVGLSEVTMEACQTTEMEMIAGKFVSHIITQLTYEGKKPDQITVIPIVECVNNEFVAGGIVKSIRAFSEQYGATTSMPFKRQFFNEAISEDIGVWTNKKTKPGYIQNFISLLVDNRLAVSTRCVCIGSVHSKAYRTPSLAETLDTMCSQLKQWKNTDKGPSGVSAATFDDMSIALMMGCYWSHAYKMTLSLQSKGYQKTPKTPYDGIDFPQARYKKNKGPSTRQVKNHRLKKQANEAFQFKVPHAAVNRKAMKRSGQR